MLPARAAATGWTHARHHPARLWVISRVRVMLALGSRPRAPARRTPALPAAAPSAVLRGARAGRGRARGRARSPQRYAYLHQLDSHLQDVAASRLGAGSAGARSAPPSGRASRPRPQGDVAVDVYVDRRPRAAADALRALGMRVTGVSERAPQRMVEGFLPPAALPQAAALASTRAIVAPFSSLEHRRRRSRRATPRSTGPPRARSARPGIGVSVGVISDSINQVGGGIAASQATGDLPANVVVLSDKAGRHATRAARWPRSSTTRRRASAASCSRPPTGGPAAKAAAIDALVQPRRQGDRRRHELRRPSRSSRTTSSRRPSTAPRAAGVAYFIAAGNDAQQSWEGTYNGGASQDFDPGPARRHRPDGRHAPERPERDASCCSGPSRGGARRRLRARHLPHHRRPAQTLLATVDTNNIASGIPEEVGEISCHAATRARTGSGSARVAGTGTPLLKYVDFTNGAGTVAIEHPTNSGRDQPRRRLGERGADGRRLALLDADDARDASARAGPVTRYFDAAGTPLAAPEVRAEAEPRRRRTASRPRSATLRHVLRHERGRARGRGHRGADPLGQAAR